MRELKYMPQWLGNPMYPSGLFLSYHSEQWQGDIKDDLVKAIKNYFSFKVDGKPELSEYEKELLLEYLVYHINAPCWEWANINNWEGICKLENLRKQADEIKSIDQIGDYIFDCLEIGLDPL